MSADPKRMMWGGALGTGATAICCFTPMAVIALGAVGVGAAAWLDWVLLPALVGFAAMFLAGALKLWRWNRECCPAVTPEFAGKDA